MELQRGEPPTRPTASPQTFLAEWDDEGVSVYQAYCDAIADFAVGHQRLGGEQFKAARMTWIKPSFGWMLYRSGYGLKPGQTRVLKLKLPHAALAALLSQCRFVDAKASRSCSAAAEGNEEEGEGHMSCGRVQWDPDRDVMVADGREPRAMRRRAIQIGLKGRLSELLVQSIVSITEVTQIAHKVCEAHRQRGAEAQAQMMEALRPVLPVERPYVPQCSQAVLVSLGMLPGPVADFVAQLGRGKAQPLRR